MPRSAEFLLGAWQVSGIYTYTSGPALIFSSAIVAPNSVKYLGQTGINGYWFDIAGFAAQPSFTRRTNPWYYPGLNGPGFKNTDLALSKQFPITERARVAIRLDAFNALNSMNWSTQI